VAVTTTGLQAVPNDIEFRKCPTQSDNQPVGPEWTRNSLIQNTKWDDEDKEEEKL
jgi:hypothetical protein